MAQTDPAVKKELAETVNKEFGEQCYDLWVSWTVWGIPHTPKVMDVGIFTLPDGTPPARAPAASFNVRSVWINPNA